MGISFNILLLFFLISQFEIIIIIMYLTISAGPKKSAVSLYKFETNLFILYHLKSLAAI